MLSHDCCWFIKQVPSNALHPPSPPLPPVQNEKMLQLLSVAPQVSNNAVGVFEPRTSRRSLLMSLAMLYCCCCCCWSTCLSAAAASCGVCLSVCQGVVPARFRSDKQLVSHDIHTSTYNYKYTFSVEIAPVCKVISNIDCLMSENERSNVASAISLRCQQWHAAFLWWPLSVKQTMIQCALHLAWLKSSQSFPSTVVTGSIHTADRFHAAVLMARNACSRQQLPVRLFHPSCPVC
jgi:hypothetical protein